MLQTILSRRIKEITQMKIAMRNQKPFVHLVINSNLNVFYKMFHIIDKFIITKKSTRDAIFYKDTIIKFIFNTKFYISF